jgi:hypothetical protein
LLSLDPDLDPVVRGTDAAPDPSIIKLKKPEYCFETFVEFLISKKSFLVAIWKVTGGTGENSRIRSRIL